MGLNKNEICEALSLDYAERASNGGANYDISYKHYLQRCHKRNFEDLMSQYRVQGLEKPKDLRKFNGHSNTEHWITTNDDDCEDGVCKL